MRTSHELTNRGALAIIRVSEKGSVMSLNQTTLLTGGMKKHEIVVSLRSASLLGMALVLLYAIPKGGLRQSGARLLLIWGDGITMAGVILLLCAGVFALGRKGIWDFVAYALYQARYLLSEKRAGQKHLTSFSDFKQLRSRSTKPLWPWVSIGSAFLAAGMLLAVAYVA